MHVSRLAMAIALGSAVPAGAQQADGLALGTLVLEAESDTTLLQDGYVAEAGRDATKVDTPIADIPQAISTITQDQAEDQQPRW